jgi:hypothetical protein
MMVALLPGAIGADISFCNLALPQCGHAALVEEIISNSKVWLHFLHV